MKQDILKRKLRAGIVGGGQGSFIGAVHRMAVELDGQAEVVAGAMSTDPQRAESSAQAWFLKRSYKSFEEMTEAEASLPAVLRKRQECSKLEVILRTERDCFHGYL